MIPNQPSFYLPARTLVDLSIGYVRGTWTYQVNVDNVFDKKYLAASLNRNIIYPSPGINVRGGVTYRF